MRILPFVVSVMILGSPVPSFADGPIFSHTGSIQAPGPTPTYSIDANTGTAHFRSLDGTAIVGSTTLNGMISAIASAQTLATTALPAGGGTMTGPLSIGTSATPVALSNAASQSGIDVDMVTPGTPGFPGPATAHHGISDTCIKKDYFGAAPAVGEIDCLNIVGRQDGLNPNSQTASDAGDLGGVLIDVASTLRSQNFTAYMEEHTSVVDTTTNTVPYFLDMQEGVINTSGHPNDDGTAAGQSAMQAWFAALIDGHGSGLQLVEQVDSSSTAGKLGHGVIDHVIQAAHYDGDQFVDIDGNGNLFLPDGTIRIGTGSKGLGGSMTSPTFALGTDGKNGNLTLGTSSGSAPASGSPYISFNGNGTANDITIRNDALQQVSIIGSSGKRLYSFSPTSAVVPGNIVLADGNAIQYSPACIFFHDSTVSPSGLVLRCNGVRLARFPDDGSAPIFKTAPVVGSP